MTKAQIAIKVLGFMEFNKSDKAAREFCEKNFTGEELTHALSCVTATQVFVKESRQEYRDIRQGKRGAGLR